MAVAFKNFLFVTSLAEEGGKGEFGSLSKTCDETVAYRLTEGDEIEEVKPRKLRPGDRANANFAARESRLVYPCRKRCIIACFSDQL